MMMMMMRGNFPRATDTGMGLALRIWSRYLCNTEVSCKTGMQYGLC